MLSCEMLDRRFDPITGTAGVLAAGFDRLDVAERLLFAEPPQVSALRVERDALGWLMVHLNKAQCVRLQSRSTSAVGARQRQLAPEARPRPLRHSVAPALMDGRSLSHYLVRTS